MLSVLVVDDIPDNVKLLSYDLKDAGYEVFTAATEWKPWTSSGKSVRPSCSATG
jgi:DNA-binding response OmpR family regulator